ncbi:MAG: hypothetical protein H6825_10500 [Planctomycetes bacterium]|nr:hypothetical protein [Planctomycetota bacterium]
MEHVLLWLEFAAAAAIVVAAGLSLTRNAERLAAAMGWGHAFAGFVVLGWATSLPEVTISISAITEVGNPGLAAGNITGSVIFNLAILGLLELFAVRRRIACHGDPRGVMPLGVFNLAMLTGAIAITFLHDDLEGSVWSRTLGVFLLGGYTLATLHGWRGQREGASNDADGVPAETGDRLPATLRCLAAGAVIMLAGLWLARIGDSLASTYALSSSFVGTLFLASVSSLPELVTGLAALRLGLLTLAAGSILGSNIFNLGVLGVCDLVYQTGATAGRPLVQDAEPHRMAANLAAGLLLTLLGMLTVRLRVARAAPRAVGAGAVAMLAVYVVVVALA